MSLVDPREGPSTLWEHWEKNKDPNTRNVLDNLDLEGRLNYFNSTNAATWVTIGAVAVLQPVENVVQQTEHPSGNVRVDPVLPVIVYSVAEVDEHGHKGGEVSKGGACCEPELPHQPVDPQLVEWLG